MPQFCLFWLQHNNQAATLKELSHNRLFFHNSKLASKLLWNTSAFSSWVIYCCFIWKGNSFSKWVPVTRSSRAACLHLLDRQSRMLPLSCRLRDGSPLTCEGSFWCAGVKYFRVRSAFLMTAEKGKGCGAYSREKGVGDWIHSQPRRTALILTLGIKCPCSVET